LYIDVGAVSKKEKETEELGIKPGDPIVPWSPFMVSGSGKTIMAKALDDRAGCAMIVEILQRLKDLSHENTVFGVMTVQEEVGLRGAATSVDVVKPDLAVVIDVSVATDTPGINDNEVATKNYLGKGPVIGFYDASMIPHIPFRDLVVRTAKENKIPYQLHVSEGGLTDASIINMTRDGIPSGGVSIATRYLHSPVEVASLEDIDNCAKLTAEAVKTAYKYFGK
jgi:endoglucanase